MPETLTGTLERITYRAPDTGYTVARLRPHGKQALVTVVGKLPAIQPGEALELEGAWVEHRAHGRQFEATSYRAAPPTTSEGIVRYLASGLIPGIGPVNAQRIVDTFGPSTLDILDRAPGRLREVKGLGSKKIAAIVSAWEQQRTIKELLLLGQDVGLSTALAVKVFKHFGELAAEIVRGDPYRLANEIEGVGFPTADRIAERLGIARDAPGRITAGLRYTLSQQASETGHCALPAAELIREAAGLLELAEPTIAAGLDEAAAAVLLVRDVDDLVFLPPFYHAETELANRLRELLATPSDVGHAFSRTNLAQLRAALRQEGFALSEAQTEAVALALHSPVTVLTGGPGTGKTTTMRAVLTLLERAQLTVLLAAPTGRAARRLAETTGHAASTIHRALEYAGGAGADRWGRNEHNPLDADLVVIDEASMLDLLLAHHLVKAVRRGAHLLFVGDADQLPSVGPGAVLRDLLASGAVPSLHLNTIFRQAADSGIIANAHAINGGAAPDAESFPDFFFFPRAEAERCAAMVVELVTSRVPRQFPGLDPRRDIQVLAATHRGPAGVAELNTRLQQALNPPHPRRPEAQIGTNLYRVGDRVIQLRNNYDLDVSNGDMGVITALDSEERTLTVQYDEVRSVTYQWGELDELALAYVISIHKSQGAEYPAVVVPLLRYYGLLLQRSLLYTAVTRARELVVLTGDWKAVEQAVANQKTNGRVTALERRLRGE